MNDFDIKSPDFTPQPGWGGKLKKLLKQECDLLIFKIVAILVLLAGLYLTFFN